MSPDSINKRLEKLYAAVVSDVLDGLGDRDQTLGPSIRPLTQVKQVCGRVFTARAVPVKTIPEKPYELEMAVIDRMQSGDVLLVDLGHDTSSAFWGELLTTACQVKGVQGVVMSGCCRDLWRLESLHFPVFGIGFRPTDSLGRIDVVEIGEPIVIDGVKARTGDWLLGDADGVVIVPASDIDDVLTRAEEKLASENHVRDDLEAGMSVAEAFKKHGIL